MNTIDPTEKSAEDSGAHLPLTADEWRRLCELLANEPVVEISEAEVFGKQCAPPGPE
jgi:hypothetical protein